MAKPGRLNQLRLADDTAFGLSLVWVYMVLDATQQVNLGANWLTRWTGNDASDPQWSLFASAAQVMFLLGLAGVIGYFRLHRLLHRVKPRRLSDVDAVFDEGATYIAQRLVKRMPLFVATANLSDTNACCVLAYPRQYVIVGGGLRLLWRKAAAQAGGIVAHECMHLAKRDTFLLIGTWYTFIAYCLLLSLNLVLHQGLFWGKVIALVPAWLETGNAVAGIVRNLIVSGVVGFPPLISALVIGLILRHMMRLREFIADEGAAQQGYRQGIVENLARAARNESLAFRLFRSFHPSARDRLERVAVGSGWARVDRLYCLGCGLIIARIMNALPMPLELACEGPSGTEDTWTVLVNCLQTDWHAWIVAVFYTAILLSVAFLIVHHTYRTVMTVRARRRYWPDAAQVVCEVWAFAVAGTLLGELTESGILRAATEIIVFDMVPVTEKFDHAIAASISVSSTLLLLVVATGVVVSFTARRFHPSRLFRTIGFVAAIAGAAVLSMVSISIPLMFFYEFGGVLRLENVVEWERSTTPIMRGTPNPVEMVVHIIVLILAVATISHLLKSRRAGKPNPASDVHQERLVPDEDWAVSGYAVPASGASSAPISRRSWALLCMAIAGAVTLVMFLRSVDTAALERPTKFTFNYPHGDKAGIRIWMRNREGVWSERYADGKIYGTFREVGRIRRQGCDGTVVERRDTPAFKVFIPDKRCKNLSLLARNGEGEWGILGMMRPIWSL